MYEIKINDNMPEWVGGRFKAPFPFILGIGKPIIEIKTKYKFDKGLLEHEIIHTKQYKKDMFYCIKYNFSRGNRLKYELEAYAKQIEIYKYTNISECKWIIDALYSKYNLNMQKSFILKKIKEILNKQKEKQ